MAFSDLTPTIQNIFITNFEFKAKAIMLIGVLIFSILYLAYLNNKPKTPYLVTNLFKTMLKWSCYVYVFSIPLLSWLLSPEVKIDLVIKFIIGIYFVSVTCLLIWLIINIFYYSPLYILKLLGVDFGVERDNKVLSHIDKTVFRGLAKDYNLRKWYMSGKDKGMYK